jgi:hypothetical protein
MSSDQSEKEICMICQDVYYEESQEETTKFSCGHYMHQTCYKEYIKHQGRDSCPMCRRHLPESKKLLNILALLESKYKRYIDITNATTPNNTLNIQNFPFLDWLNIQLINENDKHKLATTKEKNKLIPYREIINATITNNFNKIKNIIKSGSIIPDEYLLNKVILSFNYKVCNSKIFKDIIKLLLDRGFKPTKDTLFIALQRRCYGDIIKLLINNGAIISHDTLTFAIISDSWNCAIRVLLQKGALPDEETLRQALYHKYDESIICLLLKKQAKFDHQTLIDVIRSGCNQSIIQLLVRKGTPIYNPLIIAQALEKKYDVSIINFLMKNGAKISYEEDSDSDSDEDDNYSYEEDSDSDQDN